MHYENVTIIPAKAGGDLPQAGIKSGATCYLVWDRQAVRLFVVRWNIDRWTCSCPVRPCMHKMAVNEYVFERSQQRKG